MILSEHWNRIFFGKRPYCWAGTGLAQCFLLYSSLVAFRLSIHSIVCFLVFVFCNTFNALNLPFKSASNKILCLNLNDKQQYSSRPFHHNFREQMVWCVVLFVAWYSLGCIVGCVVWWGVGCGMVCVVVCSVVWCVKWCLVPCPPIMSNPIMSNVYLP